MLFMSYDTESKSRNVLASPLGEEGHEVAKGCARVRMIMILLFCLSVLCPVHPFPLRGTSPQGETRDMERKTGESYTSCTIPVFPPLVAAPPPFPRKRGHYKAPRSHVLISRSTLSTECSAPACGGCPAQPERGANAVSHSAESSSCHMTLKVNPVTLTL